jgi:hypothetical protein
MTVTIKLPTVTTLDCAAAGGDLSLGNLDGYFRSVAQLPGQIKSQLSTAVDAANDDRLSKIRDAKKLAGSISDADAAAITSALETLTDDQITDVLDKMTQVEDLIDQIESFLSPRPFSALHSKELEARYRGREVFKNIEHFFKKKIVEILSEIIGLLGIPTPLDIPLPFLPSVTVGDLFTTSGNAIIKAAIATEPTVANYFDVSNKFDGKLGVNVPEMTAEEVWQKILNWLNTTLNNWTLSVINAIVGALEDIPGIGIAIKAVLSGVDPTIAIETSVKAAIATVKSTAAGHITDAKTLAASVENTTITDVAREEVQQQIDAKVKLSQDLIDGGIDTLLSIQIPLIGLGVGSIAGIDDKATELKKTRVIISKEYLLHHLEDAFDHLIDKARMIFRTSLIGAIFDIIDAASALIKAIPIVNSIYTCIQKVVKIVRGENPFTACDILQLVVPQIFNMGSLTDALIPATIKKETSTFGFIPNIA